MIDRNQFARDLVAALEADATYNGGGWVKFDMRVVADALLSKYAVLQLPEPQQLQEWVTDVAPWLKSWSGEWWIVRTADPADSAERDSALRITVKPEQEWSIPEALSLAAAIVAASRQAQTQQKEG